MATVEVGRPRRDLPTIGIENWKGCSVSRELGIVGFWLLGKVEIELGRVNVLIGENGAHAPNQPGWWINKSRCKQSPRAAAPPLFRKTGWATSRIRRAERLCLGRPRW